MTLISISDNDEVTQEDESVSKTNTGNIMPGQSSPVTHSVHGWNWKVLLELIPPSESESELDGNITDLSDEEEVVTINDKQRIEGK